MTDMKFNTDEAAVYLGVKPRTLEVWRGERKGPKYYTPTSKLVFYFQSDLDKWIKSEKAK